LRFSLHFGDVLCIETSYGKDILGEDINIAARLNDLAAAGQIVISDAALQRLPVSQQQGVDPSETASIRRAGDFRFHRLRLDALKG
jgi:class 3 adenylate cyclase